MRRAAQARVMLDFKSVRDFAIDTPVMKVHYTRESAQWAFIFFCIAKRILGQIQYYANHKIFYTYSTTVV